MMLQEVNLQEYAQWLEDRRQQHEEEAQAIWEEYSNLKEKYLQSSDCLHSHLQMTRAIAKQINNSRACADEIASISAEILRVKSWQARGFRSMKTLRGEVLDYYLWSKE